MFTSGPTKYSGHGWVATAPAGIAPQQRRPSKLGGQYIVSSKEKNNYLDKIQVTRYKRFIHE